MTPNEIPASAIKAVAVAMIEVRARRMPGLDVEHVGDEVMQIQPQPATGFGAPLGAAVQLERVGPVQRPSEPLGVWQELVVDFGDKLAATAKRDRRKRGLGIDPERELF
jgi:hypothetical protein